MENITCAYDRYFCECISFLLFLDINNYTDHKGCTDIISLNVIYLSYLYFVHTCSFIIYLLNVIKVILYVEEKINFISNSEKLIAIYKPKYHQDYL